jgi:hypothetical protein
VRPDGRVVKHQPGTLSGDSGAQERRPARARVVKFLLCRAQDPTWSRPMKNPLDSLWGTVLCGLALTAVLYYLVRSLVAG